MLEMYFRPKVCEMAFIRIYMYRRLLCLFWTPLLADVLSVDASVGRKRVCCDYTCLIYWRVLNTPPCYIAALKWGGGLLRASSSVKLLKPASSERVEVLKNLFSYRGWQRAASFHRKYIKAKTRGWSWPG